jgi:hypothetical protein
MIDKLSTKAALWIAFASGVTISALILTPLAIVFWGAALSKCGSF